MKLDPGLVNRVQSGDHLAVARMLTHVERRTVGVDDALSELHRDSGRGRVVGVTGPPGSGKSTLVASLVQRLRQLDRSVGVIAVDPSSALSGGAILGDRIRMQDVIDDPGVYIRSVATRGALGGLSRVTLDAITVLEAAGKDVVVVETAGVGQAEVDVMAATHSVVVVSVPGMGDQIQAMKAGLLEIADVHVVNKADRPGALQVAAELRETVRLTGREPGQWRAPIQLTVAPSAEGVPELVEHLDAHHAWMTEHGELERRSQRHSATRIRWLVEEVLLGSLRSGLPAFDRAVAEVSARRQDPLTAARNLIDRHLSLVQPSAAASCARDSEDG